MEKILWDVAIVGAGPAGLMAAIAAAGPGKKILILDGKENLGAKLLISGGGRCNVTNLRVTEKDYRTGAPRTVRNILSAFPVERTLGFFKDLGVEMVLEEDTKFFPKTQSARTVLDALLRKVRGLGVTLEKGKKVSRVFFEAGNFNLIAGETKYRSRAVILCTGGLSYAGTGSDGSGYPLAKSFGHKVVPVTPALMPLLTGDPEWKTLSGITLPVRLTLRADGHEIASSGGAFLFTHQGFSGPAVLDISGSWLRCLSPQKELLADFFSGVSEGTLCQELARTVTEHPKWSWKRFFVKYFPERLIEIFLKKLNTIPGAPISQSPKKEREAVIRSLKGFMLQITGAMGYDKAEVTAGGVDLAEIDGKTLESQLQRGLFFAGEILDVDGRIGGFNFQWAWSSGTVAGRSAAAKLSD
ncbi:MAG TPA: NAD(P)/FAD-dependent oxidoreductase [Candidatus Omnitrophota bacterium]|nr:NAD(P)/FAD-dependent oxidoreductase [Candidatus Omnitrophota bacterium]HPS36852.1 NAD(P)/FAD-dependent oxidoreductase [Candidatus Omnitrophota bacterium]